jgi:enoyl-CoA hydratase/carnithine racemase
MLRVVVLSGEGADFCAGLDFTSFRAMTSGERLSATAQLPSSAGPAKAAGQRAAYVWAELPVPVIAAVRGNALGGGRQMAALALAAEIAARSPHAVRAAKRLLDLGGRVDLEAGFAAEQTEIGALIGSPNQAEAVTARFEKRDPTFEDCR